MTDEERKQDVAAEPIEDLDDAAGATLDYVVGGSWADIKKKAASLPNLYTNPPELPIGQCTQEPPPPLGPLPL